MHSRIFQVSETPIEKSDYIVESNYWDHWFLNSHADYVAESNREEDIEWLKECCYKGLVVDKDDKGEFIIVTNKEDYFKPKFDRFKKALEKANNISLEDFANGNASIWNLKNAFEERYEFYIDYADGYGELFTLDSFVRNCTIDVKYYIGGTMDYHY